MGGAEGEQRGERWGEQMGEQREQTGGAEKVEEPRV